MNVRTPTTILTLSLLVALAGCGGGGGEPTAVAGATEVARSADPPASPDTAAPVADAGARTAKGCIDPRAFEAGHRLRIQTRQPDGSLTEIETVTVGATQRNGRRVVAFRTEVPMDNGSMSLLAFRELAGDEVLEHGLRVDIRQSGRDGVIDTSTSQGIPNGFGLPVGGSASVGPINVVSTGRVTGEAPRDETQVVRFLVRLVGFETVTTPAGRFVDTCRIETTETRNGASTTSTTWWAQQLGVPVRKRAADGAEQLLTAVAIDGRVVAGRFATGGQGTVPTPAPAPGGAKR